MGGYYVICVTCRISKRGSAFGKLGKLTGECEDCRRHNKQPIVCKACGKNVSKLWYGQRCTACTEKETERRRQSLQIYTGREGQIRRYGLTDEQYDATYLKQHGRCAICLQEPKGTGMRGLYVDHDHKTGKFRGLLCPGCNTALGCFRDDPNLLRAAIRYLQVNQPGDDAPDTLQTPLF